MIASNLQVYNTLYNNTDLKKYVISRVDSEFCAYAVHYEGDCSKVKTIYLGYKHNEEFKRNWSETFRGAIKYRHETLKQDLSTFEKVYNDYLKEN